MARILVVDDDRSSVDAIARLLRDDGHEVTALSAGREAVDALAREPFDAVLTDLEMPGVDGHEVVRAAREHQPAACVVAVTARAHDAERGLLERGACFVADKPVDYDHVTAKIRECHERRRGPDGRCPLHSDAGAPSIVKLRRR